MVSLLAKVSFYPKGKFPHTNRLSYPHTAPLDNPEEASV